ARDLDAQPDAILIVVDQELADLLHEPARRALVPQRLAAAAPVVRLAGLDRETQRLGVHVAVHQQLARPIVRRHGRDQAALSEFRRELGAFLDLLDADAGGKLDRHFRKSEIAGGERLSPVTTRRAVGLRALVSYAASRGPLRRTAPVSQFGGARPRRGRRSTMALKLHNTATRTKEPFEPGNPPRVTMYVCGPTVYNYVHIGNGRPYVVFDVLARLLRQRYELVYARNLTDVDDKINAAAKEE